MNGGREREGGRSERDRDVLQPSNERMEREREREKRRRGIEG